MLGPLVGQLVGLARASGAMRKPGAARRGRRRRGRRWRCRAPGGCAGAGGSVTTGLRMKTMAPARISGGQITATLSAPSRAGRPPRPGRRRPSDTVPARRMRSVHRQRPAIRPGRGLAWSGLTDGRRAPGSVSRLQRPAAGLARRLPRRSTAGPSSKLRPSARTGRRGRTQDVGRRRPPRRDATCRPRPPAGGSLPPRPTPARRRAPCRRSWCSSRQPSPVTTRSAPAMAASRPAARGDHLEAGLQTGAQGGQAAGQAAGRPGLGSARTSTPSAPVDLGQAFEPAGEEGHLGRRGALLGAEGAAASRNGCSRRRPPHLDAPQRPAEGVDGAEPAVGRRRPADGHDDPPGAAAGGGRDQFAGAPAGGAEGSLAGPTSVEPAGPGASTTAVPSGRTPHSASTGSPERPGDGGWRRAPPRAASRASRVPSPPSASGSPARRTAAPSTSRGPRRGGRLRRR